MTWLVVLASAVSAACHLRWIVPRLREPAELDDDSLPAYATLGAPRHVAVLGVLVTAISLVVFRVPMAHHVAWIGYLGAGAALVWVDLRTTWLPRSLTLLCGTQVSMGVVVVAVTDWQSALTAMIGGLGSFTLFHLVWRFSGTFGYGDVRLAAIVGAMGGLNGIDGALMALLFGTLAGAVWGVVHSLRRRGRAGPKHFAYGPALWLGPILAQLISGW